MNGIRNSEKACKKVGIPLPRPLNRMHFTCYKL
jgi:hypothetical protein